MRYTGLGRKLFPSTSVRTAPGNGRMYRRMYRRNPYWRAYKAPFSIGVRLLGLNDGDWGVPAVEERGFSSLHSETGYSWRLLPDCLGWPHPKKQVGVARRP